MPHDPLPWNASTNFFLSRMSSSSGEERSGRKGTKMGLCPDDLGAARLGCGAWTGEVVRMMGPWPLFAGDALDGEWWGYCEGAAGFGRSPELFVKGWVARGSKDFSTELDMAAG